ncbi:MAG: ATP-binding cassette domain-containing protein [Myxococcota bacterium]
MAIIEVENLSKHYGPVKALNGVSFTVEKGEIIGLLGPNGAGKTTTMKLLTGYLQPTSGTARLVGFDVVENPLGVQSMVGYLPENAPLYLDMAVQEYLVMMAELRNIPADQHRRLLSEAIHATGLQSRLTQTIGNLSKGFRQRVGLAQAILHKPQVLILDEPTNGLDPNQIIEIRNLIKRLAQNATVIVSTHILSEVEATCDRAIIIMDGALRSDARLDAMTQSSAAVIAVNDDAKDVENVLKKLKGVQGVQREDAKNGYTRYRVTGEKEIELCPMLFSTAKDESWTLAELRPETRTLESVFRELNDRKGLAA